MTGRDTVIYDNFYANHFAADPVFLAPVVDSKHGYHSALSADVSAFLISWRWHRESINCVSVKLN